MNNTHSQTPENLAVATVVFLMLAGAVFWVLITFGVMADPATQTVSPIVDAACVSNAPANASAATLALYTDAC